MMDKDEAVQKLATAGRLSIAHAEDLYDSLFPKPVVPQCVADWYEENKKDFDYNLWDYLTSWDRQKGSDFKKWINNEIDVLQTLVNMHQFGYEWRKRRSTLSESKSLINTYATMMGFFIFLQALGWISRKTTLKN